MILAFTARQMPTTMPARWSLATVPVRTPDFADTPIYNISTVERPELKGGRMNRVESHYDANPEVEWDRLARHRTEFAVRGNRLSATTQRIGNAEFFAGHDNQMRRYSGTSQKIGDFIFHELRSSDGTRGSGTTHIFGSTSNTDWKVRD